MKKVLATVAVVGLMAAASTAFGAGIASSKHNLTPTGQWAGRIAGTNSQICVYCHAPHAANISIPLWNRSNPTATFILYSGVNMASRQFKTGFSANSTSLFCMSCHDGTTTMDAVFNEGALIRNAGQNMSGSAGLALNTSDIGIGYTGFGTDLSKTHPINFPVTTDDTQNDLFVGAGTSMGTGNIYGVTFPLFVTNDARDDSGAGRSLECGSCHAVHDSTVSPFLRYTMAGSALCLGCHNK